MKKWLGIIFTCCFYALSFIGCVNKQNLEMKDEERNISAQSETNASVIRNHAYIVTDNTIIEQTENGTYKIIEINGDKQDDFEYPYIVSCYNEVSGIMFIMLSQNESIDNAEVEKLLISSNLTKDAGVFIIGMYETNDPDFSLLLNEPIDSCTYDEETEQYTHNGNAYKYLVNIIDFDNQGKQYLAVSSDLKYQVYDVDDEGLLESN